MDRLSAMSQSSAARQPFIEACVPPFFVPKLEFLTLADEHGLLFQSGELAQLARQEYAALAVHLELRRVAEHQALQLAHLLLEARHAVQPTLDFLPIRQWVDQGASRRQNRKRREQKTER